MEIDYTNLMASKSDQELNNFINLGSKFYPPEIQAAIAEMQKRGRIFSEAELAALLRVEQTAPPVPEKPAARPSASLFDLNKNVVEDEQAPAFYSQRAIRIFSIFFSVLFGAALLASNLHSLKSKKGMWEVIGFGLVFTGLQIWILSMLPRSTAFTVGTCLAGVMLMNYLFWNKYIGADTQYRAKPIWKPLIIGILITLPIILLIVYGPKEG
ncbi:MAG TPA: hypothetical protein VGO45_13160 [Bacteroidia bacterium]|jgi:hypothetical protein|nr:hypothetical protein [Bacteroidia bacterium]